LYIDLINLNGVEVIDNFFIKYLMRPIIALKYNNMIYHSIDYTPPRYCDLNLCYITSNYYAYQKLRQIYNVRFLPYNRVINVELNNNLKLIKKNNKRNGYYIDDDLYYFVKSDEERVTFDCNNKRIDNLSDLYKNVFNNISLNYITNNCLVIPEIIFFMILGKNITLGNKIFLKSIDEYNIKELCGWLDCEIKEENIIKTRNINIDKLNRLFNINEEYVYNYIFNDNKKIPADMSYTDFLNSNIW